MRSQLNCLLLLLFFFATCQLTLAEGKFIVTVQFPSQWDKSKIQLDYNNGKETIRNYKLIYRENKVTISDNYYSRYASIVIYYKNENEAPNVYGFFVYDKPASISLNLVNTDEDSLVTYKLANVFSFESMGKDKMDAFTSSESKVADSFLIANIDKYATSDSIQRKINFYAERVVKKRMEFVKNNGHLYYSFYIFRNSLVYSSISPDSLYTVYNTAFPDSIKQSDEGSDLVKIILKGKSLKCGQLAPDFTVTDVTKRNISLCAYRGKYVILDFWASWCGPCVAELPTIARLRKKYSKDVLEIISVTLDKDSLTFSKAVTKHKLNWIQIFHNMEIVNIYNAQGVPSVYLIDPGGILIYTREDAKDFDHLNLLNQLLETRMKEIMTK